MRLTDEERAIADRVAERLYFDPMRADDAWECALQYIQTRREAFGEVETPGTATAAGVGDDAEAGDEIRLDDYVLATTWDSRHHRERFVVGSVSQYDTEIFDKRIFRRYVVKEDNGDEYQALRVAKITPDERGRLLSDRKDGESLHDCLARIRGEKTSTPATAAGVAAPPAEVSDEVVAWMVASPTGDASAVFHVREEAVRFARGVHGIVPLVRQGSPRGVVVTEAQRWAIKRAASILRRLGYHEFDPWPGVEARSLDDLLAAIDAAKGGE